MLKCAPRALQRISATTNPAAFASPTMQNQSMPPTGPRFTSLLVGHTRGFSWIFNSGKLKSTLPTLGAIDACQNPHQTSTV